MSVVKNGKKVAVVGAGIAGLSAAYYLNKFGYSVEVFEGSGRVGGRMTTDKVEDCLIDRGAQFLSESYSTLLPLINEVGLSSDLLESSPWAAVRRDQKIRRFSINSPFSPISSGYIKPLEALRFLLGMARLRSKIDTLSLSDYAAWSDFDNELASDFISREFGREFLEYLIEPQTQGFFYQAPEESSKAMAMMLLSFGLKKGKVLALRNGMGSLPEAIAKSLNVRLNCPISKIYKGLEGEVLLESPSGRFVADRVVIATTATVAKLIYEPTNDIERSLISTKYSSTVNIGIASHQDWQLPSNLNGVYGLLVPRLERHLIAGVGIESNKGPNRVKYGQLIDVMLDGQKSSAFLEQSEAEILGNISSELEILFPDIFRNIRLSHFVKWKDAEPMSPIGRSLNIKMYKESLNPTAKIVLAGDYMGFAYTDSAAATGKWTAEFIHRT